MAIDPAIKDHQTWIHYLQPEGLVVSPAALVDSQVMLGVNSAPLQQRFLEFLEEVEHHDDEIGVIRDLNEFLKDFLEWPEANLVGKGTDKPIPEELKTPLREFGETLEPDLAFTNPNQEDQPWLLLVRELPFETDLDRAIESVEAGWAASPTQRFERLLRETGVPIGLITNRRLLRLIYVPRGENPGTLTFPVYAMAEVSGRPILAAFEMLLKRYRLLAAPTEARLPALLKKSRDYQANVSKELAEQVLDALYELLRGFQAADEHSRGELLKNDLSEHPDRIYNGLLTILMRLVFLLYAEDRGLMPDNELYAGNYSVHGLFNKLRSDAQHYPDTMDHRYGAWAQLVALFRSVHDGCEHPMLGLPARHGHLFDPGRFPFLEGRTTSQSRLPLVSDGVIYRVLDKLLILDGERLSYRTLDVEQIGSVYETMMGFRLQQAGGMTIALKPAKANGAPVPVNLEKLLSTAPGSRKKWIADQTDYKLTANMDSAVKGSANPDELLAALENRIARNATPQPVAAGTMILMPTDERRKTGSHYTPRLLTEPIVRTALEPIFKQLGADPTPDQILNLKVCDPAMGSGAFLVEACRQIGDELVKAWAFHGWKPTIPPDEDEVLHARRLVAQRCLYGVDRNPMAVDLAKLSLWLATLAKDHPFTFLDHALRCGDSLVGLTREQIVGFHWKPSQQISFLADFIQKRVNEISRERRQILESGDQMPPEAKRKKLDVADKELGRIRRLGDAVVSAFFSASNARGREENLKELIPLADEIQSGLGLDNAVQSLSVGEHPIAPFHWELEFPEVFFEGNGGFDAIVGNPPFAGVTTLSRSSHANYTNWLRTYWQDTGGKCDLVAFFFRQAFDLVRDRGSLGLVATNTIAQGDTRESGLAPIRKSGGTIYSAIKRLKWPGQAAVIVSVIHVLKGKFNDQLYRNGSPVEDITSFLFSRGGDDMPRRLEQDIEGVTKGVVPYGLGFVIDNSTEGCIKNEEVEEVLNAEPKSSNLIYEYIGGDEFNTSPIQKSTKSIVKFDGMDYEEAAQFPLLLELVKKKVKPGRDALTNQSGADRLKKFWWCYQYSARELYSSLTGLKRVLAVARVTRHVAFSFLPTGIVYNEKIVVFPSEEYSFFAIMQSNVHSFWAWFFSSTMKDDLNYSPTDCFHTFPFPIGYRESVELGKIGQSYYEFRSNLMVNNNEGLTKTYNRFNDPNETLQEIIKLRELHDAMDRVVLDAYGWSDIQPLCEFILDYEDDDDDEGSSRRKKPWRYRWPDEIRDEVLARLLALNAERAAEEHRAGKAAALEEKKKGRKKKKTAKKKGTPLFD